MSNSNAKPPPEMYTTQPPPPSLSSLPDEIVLRCLARVPRIYHLSISWVSKSLRSLVLSPELNRLRSTLNKSSSIYLCLQGGGSPFHWFNLLVNDKEYPIPLLLPDPTPFPPHNKYGSSTVVVGPNIFFIGGCTYTSSDLWILDTRSGKMTQGPSMSVPREECEVAVGVIDGKIYVIGSGPFPFEGSFHEVEVFDLKSGTWELAGTENVRGTSRCGASVEGKVYMVEQEVDTLEYQEISVYNPRESQGRRLVHMVSECRLVGETKDKLIDYVFCVCVVEGLLFALFELSGVMWFNTKLNVWVRLVGRGGKELPSFVVCDSAMAEHDGKLAVLYWDQSYGFNTITKSVWCTLVSLDRAGDMICGTIDWSGSVGTVPHSFDFLHCLAVSS